MFNNDFTEFFGIPSVVGRRASSFFVDVDTAINQGLRTMIEAGKGNYARVNRKYNSIILEDETAIYTYDVAGLDEEILLESVKVSANRANNIVVEFKAKTERPYGTYEVDECHTLGLNAGRRWSYSKKVENGILVITFTPKEPRAALLEEVQETKE